MVPPCATNEQEARMDGESFDAVVQRVAVGSHTAQRQQYVV